MSEVLIADDSAFARSLLREVVSGEHDVVGEVENGVEAVEVCKSERPDVVLMAVEMPIRDGIDATATITDAHPDTGVVVCTVADEVQTKRAAFDAGADGYVTKPFQRSGVLTAIDEALSA